jgi:hypothetical protein
MNRSLPSLARLVFNWPFWTLVKVLLYCDVVHVPSSSFVSSFRHECIATVRKIYTRMHMHDLIDGFDLINCKTTHDNHGVHGWLHLHR